MDIPAYTQQTATQARQYRHHRHHKQRQEQSYENQLVTASSEDELDDPDVVVVGSPEVVAAVAAIASSKAREMRNRSGSYSNLFDADFEAALVNSSAPVSGDGATTSNGKPSAGAVLLAAAMSGKTESMYINVPAPPADANLHVYSNVIDERQQQQNQQRDPANNVLSSTLLCDDLDLDDPVSASFVASAHTQRKSHGDGAEQVKSAERLRMLHDTTMIDTALDLDSLDGSSMGNNSQSCLVKGGKPGSTSSNLPIV
ncbi:hypothetical protein KR026_007992 [Drosophila bipectinata]|nr:hypothetical protein KR026_007992 [Drosophila bipectinata]